MRKPANIAFWVSAIFMCAAVYALYPFYQYYVDPDATAYLTISRRYLEGDFNKAINAYWSPWACWLTAAWSSLSGWGLMASAVAVNALGGLGVLFISHSLFRLFKLEPRWIWLCQFILAAFLSYAVYGQLFDDLWQVFFLLAVLRLLLRGDFADKPLLWAFCGVLGALAYFAKAYSFPFFILNVLVCSYFISRDKMQWLKMASVAIIVMIVCSIPWIYALHGKYGEWMTGTAGKLNRSWYVLGQPIWKEGTGALLPPVYGDSPYYWEDPYMVNGATPHGFSSLAMMKLQMLRIPYNLLKMMESMTQLSAMFPALLIGLFAVAVSKKVGSFFPDKLHIVAISFLLFPLAFILINFEARYLWYMLPLSLLCAALLLQRLSKYAEHKWQLVFVAGFMALSYLFHPLLEMKNMYQTGVEDKRLADRLKEEGIAGSFTAITERGAQVQGIERLAYFSGNSFYAIPHSNITHNELLSEMRRYGVKYYLHFYNKAEGDSFIFRDEQGEPVPEALRDEAYGLQVLGPLE